MVQRVPPVPDVRAAVRLALADAGLPAGASLGGQAGAERVRNDLGPDQELYRACQRKQPPPPSRPAPPQEVLAGGQHAGEAKGDREAVAEDRKDGREVGGAGQSSAPEARRGLAHVHDRFGLLSIGTPRAATATPPTSARTTAASRTGQVHRANRSVPRCQCADRTRGLVFGVSIDATCHGPQ